MKKNEVVPGKYMTELKHLLHDLVHTNKDNAKVEDLSLAVCKSESTIYKAVSLTEDNPPAFDIYWLAIISNLKKNYKVVSYLNKVTGHFPPLRIPRVKAQNLNESKTIINYKKVCDRAFLSLYEFVAEPEEEKLQELHKNLDEIIKESVSIQKAANPHLQKKLLSQMELFDEQ